MVFCQFSGFWHIWAIFAIRYLIIQTLSWDFVKFPINLGHMPTLEKFKFWFLVRLYWLCWLAKIKKWPKTRKWPKWHFLLTKWQFWGHFYIYNFQSLLCKSALRMAILLIKSGILTIFWLLALMGHFCH